ncbi:MAG TPA: hypothetical protein VN761_06275 [Candidatus Polarisedimenticolia bacterium]|nr:hypothetical protein [Candidatus Polarisedimenticolia bacterium]
MAPLESVDGQTAHCTTHGGKYQILFTREFFPSPAAAMTPDDAPPIIMSPTPGSVCVQHPSVAAAYTCQKCCADICETCDFPQPDGGHLCPACARQQAISTAGASAPLRLATAPSIAVAPPVIRRDFSVPEGVRCVQHSHLQATAKCKACGAFMCQTCAFDLPGGVKICPTCATAAPKLSPTRKKYLIASYVLAVWCTIVQGAVFLGAFRNFGSDKASVQALGLIIMVALPLPALIGVALATSAMDRRIPNTIAMWISLTWNGLILAGFLLLMVFGMVKKGL